MSRFQNYVILIIIGMMAGFSGAEEELPEIRQITTYPEADLQPAVSRDGKWLAFVSQRSGNLDIWVKRLPNGETVQVTTHQSDDLEPAWSPDGRALVFTSKRRDAQGDLWLVKINRRKGGIPQGSPVQLTTHLGIDRKPCFSPDGEKIVYVSDEDGTENLRICDVKTRKTDPLTRNGGKDPAWSPDGKFILFTSYFRDPGGDITLLECGKSSENRLQINRMESVTEGPALDGHAAWSPLGDKIVFVRRDEDSDQDGKITPLDRAKLWIRILKPSQDSLKNLPIAEYQITSGMNDDTDPCFGTDGRIAFTSDRGRGVDVWSMPENGVVSLRPSAVELMAAVDERFAEAVTEPAIRQEIVEYKKIPALFPEDSIRCARSLLRSGELYQMLNDEKHARQAFEGVRKFHAARRREAENALLRLATLKSGARSDRIAQCRQLVSTEGADPSNQAEAWILLGELLLEENAKTEAFAAFGKVPSLFPRLKNACAQALLRIGDLFQSQDQFETARQYYFSVLREYGTIPLWRERAGGRLLGQVGGSDEERIHRYGRMIQDFSDHPALMAEAQFAIVRILIDQGQIDSAVRELENVPALVPTQDWAHARAKILHAEASRLRGDELRSIFLLESVIKDFAQVEAGRYSEEAKSALFELCYESGERLKNQGDLPLSASRYRKAMELQPNDIKVHRGYIETQARLGNTDAVVDSYRELLTRKPKSPVLLYGYGLALSYKGERDSEILKKSNLCLLQSLNADYRIVYPYRTMGYNYEAMEKLEESQKIKKRPRIIRAFKAVLSPVSWAAGVLPLGRRESESGYYEKAIDVLTTALELNDENADPSMEISLIQNLANNFYNLGEFGFAKALQYYRKRLDMDTSFSNPLEKAVFYERAGHAALYMDETEASAGYLTLAIQTYDRLDREDDVMRNMRRRAWLRQQAGKYQDAVPEYIALADKDERMGKWSDLELDFRNIAYNFHLLDEPEDALKYAVKAERILDTQDIPKGPSKKSYLRIGIFGYTIPVWGMEEIGGASAEGFTLADEQVFVTGLISRSHESLRQFPQAIVYERKRLDQFQRRKDRIAERISLNRMGLLHFKSAAYDSAWSYFERSFSAAEKHKDVRGQWANAVDLGNTAIVMYASDGQTAGLLKTKQLLGKLAEQLSDDPAISRRDRIAAHSTLGTVCMYLSQSGGKGPETNNLAIALHSAFIRLKGLGEARVHFQKALAFAKDAGLWKEEATLLASLAETDRLAGDRSNARSTFENCRLILEREGDEELLWRIEASLARLAALDFTPGDTASASPALKLFRRAMNRLEFLPAAEENGDEKLSDRQERESIYQDAAGLMIRAGFVREALVTAERGRERRVADLLLRHPPDLRKERHKIALDNLRFMRDKLADRRRQILAASTEGVRPSKLRRLKEEEQADTEDYRKELQGLQKEDALLAYLAGGLPIDSRAYSSDLPADGGALTFLLGKETTLAWFLSPDTLVGKVIPQGRADLEYRIEGLLRCIERDSLVQANIDTLFDLIILPFKEFVSGRKTLVIVPDGVLWRMPFRFCMRNHTDFQEPSLTCAPSLAYNRFARERRKINQESGILVGDIREQALAGSMKSAGIDEKVLIGPQATEQAFIDGLNRSDFVQIEARILPDRNDPLSSAIVLNPDSSHEGYFRAGDLFGHDIRANLVSLAMYSSAAESPWNPEVFFYGLLYSDVPSILISQWTVDRPVKRIFFDRFYKSTMEVSFIEAVDRAAGLVRSEHPPVRNWGGYMLVGFQGMGPDERIAFAETNQVQTILQARYYEEKKEFKDAISEFEKAIILTRIIRDSSSFSKIYQEIVRVAIKGKMWPKAIEYQSLLLALNEKSRNQSGILTSCRNLVYFFMQSSRFDEAARIKTRQIALLDTLRKTQDLLASYEEMGFILAGRRKYAESVEWIDRALQLRETGDTPGIARDHILKGRFLLEAEDLWAARKELDRGVSVLDSIARAGKADEKLSYDLASGLQLLGISCEKLSQFGEAITCQEKAFKIFKSLSRPIQMAQGEQYLANVFWKTGDYQKALAYQNTTLDMLKKLDNQKLFAMAHGTMGLIQLSLGDTSSAFTYENKALDIVDQEPSLLEDRAVYLKNLGLISLRQGRPESALIHFKQAMAIDSAMGLQSGLGYDYRNLGNAHLAAGREKEASVWLRRALSLSRAQGDQRNAAQCRIGLGKVYEKTGEIAPALASVDSALAEIEAMDVPDLSWRLLRLRGRVLNRSDKKSEAMSDFLKAVGMVETMRGGLKMEAFQQGFMDDPSDLYEDAIRVLLEQQKPGEAFRLAESAKSRNFVDLIANQSIPFPEDQREIMDREEEAFQAVQEAKDMVSRSFSSKSDTSRDRDVLHRYWTGELEARGRKHGELLEEIKSLHPELASFVSVDPWNAERIQTLLPDSVAIVEYFSSRNGLFIWVIRNNSIKAKAVGVVMPDLAEHIGLFRKTIQSRLSTGSEARLLYQWLIEPVASELAGAKHLVIIPHGKMHYIPFAALENAGGEYLIERFTLSNAPSATVWAYCFEKSIHSKTGAPGSDGIFALGNPDLGDVLYDLPFAEKEVLSLRRTFPAVNAFLGKDATKQAVRLHSAEAGLVVHFACHAEYSAKTPLNSALLLAPGASDDGRFTAREIFNLPLSCGLVTLSACETGLGESVQGDEIIGLERSFIFSGAPAVMTTLWKVDDLAAAVLMKRFYRYMKAGNSKAESLRKAQVLVRNAVNAHPSAWAAFGLTGDFQ
jgi:CHAT domain-containing protein/tetratricopeptide (TPR) repeat protein/Tol biopolymer transport system component